jgi:hypothetical protein
MRIRLASAATLVLAVSASGTASAEVQFIDQNPISVGLKAGATTSVEVFNGSARPQNLGLRVLGASNGEFAVTPGGGNTTGPGDSRTFSIVLNKPPKVAADRTLLATSSDGTAARLALRIGSPAPPALSLPKSLDLGTGDVGDTRTVAVPELPAVKISTPVGRLYTTGGERVLVTVERGRKLKVAAPHANGTYTGDVNVDGATKGGIITLTVQAKDGLLLPLIALLGGIAVGFIVEWWLTRWRPRSLLDRRLGRLIDAAESRRERLDATMKRLFAASRPENLEIPEGRSWAVPQIVTTDIEQIMRYHLTRAGKDLETRLQSARTDPERALFGPDGDAYKALLTDADTYAALVGDLREAASIVRSDLEDLRDQGPVALRTLFDFECRDWIIGDENDLAARRDAATALKAAAEKFAEYRRRLQRAIDDPTADPELVKKLIAHRRLLQATFRGDSDQIDWWDEALPKLEAELEALISPPPSAAGAAEQPQITLTQAPTALTARPELGPTPAAAAAEPEPPWPANHGVLRTTDFGRVGTLIGIINLLIVAAAGLSVGYLANATFGSTADYVTLALWGSTATAGLALVRRLLPGALTTVQPGVGG